jgi:hypothetical protein
LLSSAIGVVAFAIASSALAQIKLQRWRKLSN